MNVLLREHLTEKRVLITFVILTLLNFADLITTLVSLTNGIYEEFNTVIRFLYYKSPVIMILYKSIIPAIPFIFLFSYLNQENRGIIKTVIANSIFISMIFGVVVYFFVVFHNILLLSQL